jgi:hypothetical protein
LDATKWNKFPFTVIDSLNVGVTAGIFINNVMLKLKKEVGEGED